MIAITADAISMSIVAGLIAAPITAYAERYDLVDGSVNVNSDENGDRTFITDMVNTALRKNPNADSIDLDFGKNICFSPALMRALYEKPNIQRNGHNNIKRIITQKPDQSSV